MGNAIKGQVTFEAQGKTWVLEFSPNGFCALEEETGKPTMTFLDELDSSVKANTLEIVAVRRLFWAGLQEHAPELTLSDAGRLMREVGGVDGAMDLAGRAVHAAFPQDDKAKPPGKRRAPRRK